jgi:NTE family protein
MKRNHKSDLFLFVILISVISGFGQGRSERETVVKPKRLHVGLALDAGGALGIAHIGVIQWMEEHRVPVDYVAGTSMGGLVGGAYATGMTAADLRKLVSHIDWQNTVFNGQPQYRDLTFRMKEDRRAYPNSLEFGLNHGVRLPTGLNSGENVDRLIAGFALPYPTVENFDELPIPFRCVATDLNSGEMYVFKSGVLGDALRASMSIPAIFEPVRIGDRMFVDGTLLDPLPTDVAKDMGADVVIAVFLESYVPNKTPQTPFGTLFRSLEAVTLNNERRNMNGADVLLKVPVLDMDNLQYEKWETIIARGYAEAEKNSAALLKYALSEKEWKEYISELESRKKSALVPQYVTVQGGGSAADNEELAAMRGKVLDVEAVDRKLAEIAAEGKFGRVHPRLTTGSDDTLALEFQTVKKEYGPVLIEPLVLLDGSDYNNVRFSAGARFIMPNLGFEGTEMRTDVLIGSTYRFGTEYFWPLAGSKHWFTAARAGAENAPLDFYTNDGKVAEYRRIETSGGFDVGYTFSRFSEVRVGYELGWLKYSNDLGPKIVPPSYAGKQSIANFRFTLDRLDDPVVPSRGLGVESLFSYYDRRPGAAESFPSMQLKVQVYQPVSQKGSVYMIGSAGSTFGFTDAGFPLYSLGSTTRLAAYGANEILTNQYWLVQTGYIHKLMAMPPMTGKNVYFTSGVEIAKPFYTAGVSSLPMDVRVGVIAQTLLGPIQVGTSFGDRGHRKFYFQIGRVF